MRRTNVLLAVLAIMLGMGFVLAQQDWDRVQIKTTHVAGNVYMLEGRGGNIGVWTTNLPRWQRKSAKRCKI